MLSAGSKFGRYTVVRMLGAGGVGAVYLVRHEVLDAYFALKVLSSDVAARNAQFIPRFLREAKLCCRIRHPNLVTVHDAGRDDATGLHYLVMDYAPGGNLREMLSSAGGPLDSARALKIMRELASALVTAADFGLVHRDIKPENIMFGQNGEAKLADLGIAKASDDTTLVTMENAVFGTPAYMSPEQAYDSGKVDARADIYSLGIVFFEMLSGRRPYEGSSSMNVIAKVLSREPVPDVRTFAPEVSEKLAAVVRDMCEKNATKRIRSAQELLDRLDEIAGTRTAVVRSNVKSGIDPITVLSVVGVLAALAIAGGFAWVFMNSKESAAPAEEVMAAAKTELPAPAAPEQPPVAEQNQESEQPPAVERTSDPEQPLPAKEQPAVEQPPVAEQPQVVDVEPPPVKEKVEPRRPVYVPPKPATVIRPETAVVTSRGESTEQVNDPVLPGKAVVLGGDGDNAGALKELLGASSFQTAENAAHLAEQLDSICSRRPSRVYIKLGSTAARDGTPKDIFDNRIRSVADRLRDNGVEFEFVLEGGSGKTRPYDDVVREVCNQKSYTVFGGAASDRAGASDE